MNFKSAFEKLKAGEATPEEEAFVLYVIEEGERISCAPFDGTGALSAARGIPDIARDTSDAAYGGNSRESGNLDTALDNKNMKRNAPSTVRDGKKTEVGNTETPKREPKTDVFDRLKNAKNNALDILGSALVKTGNKIRPAEIDEIKRVKKLVFKKNALTALAVSVAVLTVTLGAIAAFVFGTAFAAAKNDAMSESEAIATAIVYLRESGVIDADDSPLVFNADRELELEWNLKNSYFEYEIEFEPMNSRRITVVVNATTGGCTAKTYPLLADD
ncbi:MAG: hypothetical protein LBP79_04530 [Clostridiales bacterium]|jgi:hypothetical protein|nr:hypothetical protein [Clostridiales bacterium]